MDGQMRAYPSMSAGRWSVRPIQLLELIMKNWKTNRSMPSRFKEKQKRNGKTPALHCLCVAVCYAFGFDIYSSLHFLHTYMYTHTPHACLL